MPVICIKLDGVPGLSSEVKASVRRRLHHNKSKGAHNIPGRFSDNTNMKCTVISEQAFSKANSTCNVVNLRLVKLGWLLSQVWHIPKDARNLHQVGWCPWPLK